MRNNVLIIGAGASGKIVGADIISNTKYNLIGYLDDAKDKQGKELNTLPIHGTTEKLPNIIYKKAIDYVIISIPHATGATVYKILNKLLECDVRINIVAGYYHFLDKDTKIRYPLSEIELGDIFKESRLTLNLKDIVKTISDKRVLVTGAGGSIGKELSILLGSLNPAELILLGRGENSIYSTYKEVKQHYKSLKISYRLVNIVEYKLLEEVFANDKPDVIFHAAAHKHVNLMENHIKEAIHNNIGGTLNLLKLSEAYEVSSFVLISTDKAVRPSNVMGATKRVVELLMLHYASKRVATKYCAVRFGNVLGSRGSVVPLFKKQIELGGPITVTDKGASRYFMSISEASQLVIQACSMSVGGEIFVLNMGKPILIYDLARLLIKVYKPNLYKDIEIVYTGLKAGEKLHEQMWDKDKEREELSIHKDIYVLERRIVGANFLKGLENILRNLYTADVKSLKESLFELTTY